MTPAEAIEAAELAEAETRYRNQVAREMAEAGTSAARRLASPGHRRVKAVQHGLVLTPNWRNGAGAWRPCSLRGRAAG